MAGSTNSSGRRKEHLLEGALDLTRPLGEGMRIPGDPEVRLKKGASLERDGFRLTRIFLGSHSGTHLDSPRHLLPDGAALDEFPLGWMAGPALVVFLDDPPCLDEERAADLDLKQGEALLLKTSMGDARRPEYHPATGPLVTPGGARALVKAGIRLVGIDYPSIEPLEGEGLETHRVLLGAGILILEELDLRKVPPGRGTLFCFPLLFPGADGAPARVLYQPNSTLSVT